MKIRKGAGNVDRDGLIEEISPEFKALLEKSDYIQLNTFSIRISKHKIHKRDLKYMAKECGCEYHEDNMREILEAYLSQISDATCEIYEEDKHRIYVYFEYE